MGYRHHFYLLENSFIERIRENNTIKELIEFLKKESPDAVEDYGDDDFHIALYHLGPDMFDFGKHYEHAVEIQKTGTPLFASEELTEYFDDYKPYICGKEAFLSAIEYSRKHTLEYFQSLLMTSEELFAIQKYPDTRTPEEKMKAAVMDKIHEWQKYSEENPEMNVSKELDDHLLPYNLDENSSVIVRSWSYEYQVFELVRRMKTIDWEKYSVLFMGW